MRQPAFLVSRESGLDAGRRHRREGWGDCRQSILQGTPRLEDSRGVALVVGKRQRRRPADLRISGQDGSAQDHSILLANRHRLRRIPQLSRRSRHLPSARPPTRHGKAWSGKRSGTNFHPPWPSCARKIPSSPVRLLACGSSACPTCRRFISRSSRPTPEREIFATCSCNLRTVTGETCFPKGDE